MSEPITISKKTPASKSMQYDFLRKEGIAYIQKLAGKIWTDYNAHDPGVTILEVLSYAITELGYRANYPMQDILSLDPDDPEATDIKNFFTAREILHNSAVTINDYRKILIDIDLPDPLNKECGNVGVKNAWIEKSSSNEIPVFANIPESKLDYDPPAGDPGKEALEIGILYDILLEFEKCDAYGDLNENSMLMSLTIENHSPDPELNGMIIMIEVEFPRWDDLGTDWEDVSSIRSNVRNIRLQFSKVPDNYDFTYELVNNSIRLNGTITNPSGVLPVPGISQIEARVNDFIYYGGDSLLAYYLQKIDKIKSIIEKVKSKLHANRNLCEDFYRLNALRVEKIAVCADIELSADADVDEVQAEMYHAISKFLSPTVNFYSLDEMLDKCMKRNSYTIGEIDISNRYFMINGVTDGILADGDEISITGSLSNNGSYTVESLKADLDKNITKVYVAEEITSDLLTEGESLVFFSRDEEKQLTTDQIFEGPSLEHGFIDDEELIKADRKKQIHVSDIIQIIMDIPGIIAVRSIQIANIPQDNEDGGIESKSVRWCMQLAYEKNYVPRLSVLDSKLTFYKDQLPFRASSEEVEQLMAELEKKERSPKLFDPLMDFDIPSGIYRDLESYESIQNEFPLTYGIGEEGVATLGNDNDANTLRLAQARQLKAYLMTFDQLLANYFSQLAHVKDLFSMNPSKDETGNYEIGRTYYTQPLFELAPDVDTLYVDKNGHEVALENIVESKQEFFARKNKFLDHLIGRFAETFTDYALLVMNLSGNLKTKEELIEDKLAFLNAYPDISAGRGKGFDYMDSCSFWHSDNVSGMRKRASFLSGIDEQGAERLRFRSNFEIAGEGDEFIIKVSDSVPSLLMNSAEKYSSVDKAKLALEKMIISGCSRENFSIISEDSINYHIELICENGEVLGISERMDYIDDLPGGEADLDAGKLSEIFKNELLDNPESNRNNLSCPLLNYIDYSISIDMISDPPRANVNYQLYSNPFEFNPSDKLMQGQFIVEGDPKSELDIISVNTSTGVIEVDGEIAALLSPGDIVVIADSQDNDADYTVVSASIAGGKTYIIVSEPLPSNNPPFGELLYNNDTSYEMMMKAEDGLYDLLWELIERSSIAANYYFSSAGGSYKFMLTGKSGRDIGESIQSDFNSILANEINNLPSGQIYIVDSAGNDGSYDIANATADDENVEVSIITSFPVNSTDGRMEINESYAFICNMEENSFLVNQNLTQCLYTSDAISISGSESSDGEYSILDIEWTGTETTIHVLETIPADEISGELRYKKQFEIEELIGNKLTIKGGYEYKAVNDFVSFIKEKFFSHEGLHVLEHVLIRPKVKGLHFVDAIPGAFEEGLANMGFLFFNKTLPVFSASSTTDKVKVDGDITSELDGDQNTLISSEICITGAGANDGTYRVKKVEFISGRTEITLRDSIPLDIPFTSPIGDISYLKGTPILDLSSAALSLQINDPDAMNVMQGEIVEVRGSSDGINDGRFVIDVMNDLGTAQEALISRVEAEVEDKLLNIVLEDNDCDDCQIEDPYTCIASVILPHWQGRFDNMDFRRFFEKQIRMEAPAHVFLTVCWISCEQMALFEEKYKVWLIENARQIPDPGRLSQSQNELVDVLNELRNVYPSGRLHDCEEDETLENAIILNNSVIGNA